MEQNPETQALNPNKTPEDPNVGQQSSKPVLEIPSPEQQDKAGPKLEEPVPVKKEGTLVQNQHEKNPDFLKTGIKTFKPCNCEKRLGILSFSDKICIASKTSL